MNTWKRWFNTSRAVTIDGEVRFVTLDTFLNLTLATPTGKNHDRAVGKVLNETEFSWCGSDLHERVTRIKFGRSEYVVIETNYQLTDQPYVIRANAEYFADRVARNVQQENWKPMSVTHPPCRCHNCQAGKFSGETYRGLA